MHGSQWWLKQILRRSILYPIFVDTLSVVYQATVNICFYMHTLGYVRGFGTGKDRN